MHRSLYLGKYKVFVSVGEKSDSGISFRELIPRTLLQTLSRSGEESSSVASPEPWCSLSLGLLPEKCQMNSETSGDSLSLRNRVSVFEEISLKGKEYSSLQHTCADWSYVNLTQMRVIWKEEILNEKMPP